MTETAQALASLSADVKTVPADKLAADHPEVMGIPEGEVREVPPLLVCRWTAQAFLTCPLETPGGADILRLVCALQEKERPDPSGQVLRYLQREETDPAEAERLCAALGYQRQLRRTVMLLTFEREHPHPENPDALSELIPMAEEDVLLPLSSRHAVLIKDLSDLPAEDDLRQFGEAVQNTLSDETGDLPYVAISTECERWDDLPGAFRQAQEIQHLLERFRQHPQVALYRDVTLERLLENIPPEQAEAYCAALMGQSGLLSDDEMLTTVRTFLDKDLNLSDTARQLYIHRNTIIYRLDKLQKATGLDLRSFQDAVVLYLMLMLSGINPKA